MINLETKAIIEKGTVLKKSLIQFVDGTKYFPDKRYTWRHAQKDKSLSSTGTLTYKHFGILSDNRSQRDVDDFFRDMRYVSTPLCVYFGDPVMMIARHSAPDEFIRTYREECRKRGHDNAFDMVLIKLPCGKNKAPQSVYDSIKGELTFGEYACANQCIATAMHGRGTKSKATAVVAQMAGPKKSNRLWSVVEVLDLCHQLCPKDSAEKFPMVMALDEFQKMN